MHKIVYTSMYCKEMMNKSKQNKVLQTTSERFVLNRLKFEFFSFNTHFWFLFAEM